ncbi:hypothetical protein MMB17_03090 [Methylobacterium organophilum]|uniref:hypothetical protein n=1 Tax=Methylobacterium organophilum TaxID=410 RepID=UPI001F12F0B4|nr:hypothetical protein [Methylobacterium organophilum]UMY18348.1 hypothetical protein MMB17_03090 [Methylobacterium organophilum]
MRDEGEGRARLGEHVAPAGLYAAIKARPFLGSVHCSHDTLVAGSWHEVVLTYEVGACGIADGATFKATFKFYSDWALFQTADPAAANYVSAEYEAGPLAPGQSPATVQSLSVRFDQKGHERPFQKAVIVDVVDGYLNAGDRIVLRLGDRRAGGPGTRVQTFVEDGFRFRCYVDPLGTSRYVAVPGDPVVRIVAGPPERLQLAAPRFVAEGVAPSLTVALLDRWGNIARDQGGRLDVTAALGDRIVSEQSHAVPAEGWAALRIEDLPPVSGTMRLRVVRPGTRDPLEGEAFVSGLADAPVPRALYGDLHVHAHDTVGTNSPAYNAAYARDVAGVDVYGYTANDFQITDEAWRQGVAVVSAFDAPGRFVAYAVQEWCGSSTAGGDHQVLFLGEDPPGFPFNGRGEHNRTFLWNESMQGTGVEVGRWPVEDLWAAYIDDPENHLVIPHVGGRRYIPDWHHPELERLVEIASAWGQFEWLYRDVIARGYRLGVCANGDEHRGRPGGGVPGVQVFGVRGGLTGILSDSLDRRSVGRALRARRTFATTGERSALLVRCGDHIQGDAFVQDGPARLDYRFLGEAGWEELTAHDQTGPIWRRDLHAELGYSERLVRLRWGGARIRDRYRWASWEGRIRILNGTIRRLTPQGFEHAEETAWRAGPTEIAFRSETYGDSDAIEIDIGNLDQCRFVIEGTIGGFVKVGDPRRAAPFVHAPDFHWDCSGRDLLEQGALRRELGGTELFLALERLTERPLPRDVAGHIVVAPENASFGFRPVYFSGRQRDGSRVWSSAQFITFAGAAPVSPSPGEAG